MPTAAKRLLALLCVTGSAALLCTGPVAAAPAPQFETYCTPAIPGLEELSGMTAIGADFYALGDSGTDDKLAVLDENCGLVRWMNVPVDPYDTEDVSSFDGQLWLSDTGDNLRRRDTISLTRMNPQDGSGELHRLTYPDTKHDAEAVLIERGGRPVIVTKEFSAPAGIYVPAGGATVSTLPSPGPSPLEKVGQVSFGVSPTTGQPAPPEMVTGGAVSADGTVAALRTYASVYVYAIPNGDIVAALTTETPLVIPVTGQPQGESVTFDSSGDLLAGSETGGVDRPFVPLQILRHATDLVTRREPVATSSEASDGGGARWWWLAPAVVVAGVAGVLIVRRRSPAN